ncbi:DUF6544 family protein [Fodinibius sediminis]|uniref:Uncharacterized protein n=1 Tax=Fodinibius sediminis TaxID=1214077 RepID=A0A521F1B8_9BACT|nr:DUF6544 family protein [Fodinibius sediminis]SMO89953.1 hypothetical protein SAMN06265218_12133 [Fodinibius sediminis]
MAKIIFSLIIFIHGLIHFLGFVKAFNLAQVDQLTQEISKPVGLLWLLSSILFLLVLLFYLNQNGLWWKVGAITVTLSQILIILSWGDTKFGTIANIIIIVPIIIAIVGQLPSSYQNQFKTEVEKRLNQDTDEVFMSEKDIAHLPLPVQKYLRYTGAIGKKKIHNFRAVFQGQFKPSPGSGYLDVTAIQYNFFDQPSRIFFMDSSMYGIPIEGLHMYIGSTASMQIKMASLIEVVNARGPEMNKSETVTLFNDMCFLAPATLIDKNIQWQGIDSTTVNATYTNQGNTIKATLFFNENGELINFSSQDRSESADGKSFTNYKWTTPLSDYQDFDGRKLASHGEAVWHKPEGEYTYTKLHLVQINYNYDELEWVK